MIPTKVSEKIKKLAFKHDNSRKYLGILLVGSHAKSKHNWYSDLDLVFVSREEPDEHDRYRLLYDHDLLVSLSVCSIDSMQSIFENPLEIMEKVQGLKDAQILRDTDENTLKVLQDKAIAFRWTDQLKESALKEAIYILRGNAEEVHKVLGGLEDRNKYSLLQGAWGICLAMPNVLALKYCLFSEGDSKLAEQVILNVGRTSVWSHYYSLATGEVASCRQNVSPLANQSLFAVLLYRETAILMKEHIEKSFLDKEFFDVVLKKIDEVPVVTATLLGE